MRERETREKEGRERYIYREKERGRERERDREIEREIEREKEMGFFRVIIPQFFLLFPVFNESRQ